VVKAKNCGKEIELEYSFDRLSAHKIVQAYRLLVPERIWTRGDRDEGIGSRYEDSSDLCTGLLGAAERGANHW
jgi:hypothetical protein